MQVRIVEQLQHAFGDVLRIADPRQKTGDAINHHISRAQHIGRDTGTPQAIASSSTYGKPSYKLESTSTSNAA